MSRRTTSAVFANPVLVGAVTVLVVVVAVFLAYNANSGLPFVPTYELKAAVPNGAQLVPGNEVREGGHRIGTVTEITPDLRKDKTTGAELLMQLDAEAGSVPADSRIRIRPRSALGLKYVELQRGKSKDTLPEGSTITAGEEALAPELQQFFNLFDEKTRTNVTANLNEFGGAFAARGLSVNRALESLPRFLRSLPPVMMVLHDPDTRLLPFFSELEDAARISAPLAETIADGFRAGADTFSALVRDPEALKETISESPPTLAVGTTALRNMRPFLRSLANVAGDLRLASAELRRSAPPIRSALQAGIGPLRQTPALNRRLGTTFDSLTALARSPGADTGVSGLTETMTTLRPLTRYLGPYVTVCNYWNYSWTFLADHITDQDQTGQIQRIRAKMADGDQMNLGSFGQAFPVKGLHAQPYGAAVDAAGNADCEQGQRGYPQFLANGLPADTELVGEPVTPGNQGPTFTGLPRVPKGETFTSVAEGLPGIDPGNLRP
ncbi:MAG: phospholipid/cholesterol/gamma-HCH transport system substrate-binding protein [Solirubrobacteraceae bacterium]|jgi:virulence factor Mce-like protein|nr:phospholipid/cholesterol/gamma-HCH transport system substrate-binding protein [Solirubrobacteraceae bacterium]